MSFGTLRLTGTAFAVAAMLASIPANAQVYRATPNPPHARLYTRDGYPKDSFERDQRERMPPRRADLRPRCRTSGAGNILGAIAGGLLGSGTVGPQGNAGALAGHGADRDCG